MVGLIKDQITGTDEMKRNESAVIYSAFENRLGVGLV